MVIFSAPEVPECGTYAFALDPPNLEALARSLRVVGKDDPVPAAGAFDADAFLTLTDRIETERAKDLPPDLDAALSKLSILAAFAWHHGAPRIVWN